MSAFTCWDQSLVTLSTMVPFHNLTSQAKVEAWVEEWRQTGSAEVRKGCYPNLNGYEQWAWFFDVGDGVLGYYSRTGPREAKEYSFSLEDVREGPNNHNFEGTWLILYY